MRDQPRERLEDAVTRLRGSIAGEDLVHEAAAAATVDPDWLEERLRISMAEAEHATGFLSSSLRPDQRILEVGAGLGLTSALLVSSGLDVTSVEPGGEGFEDYDRANVAVRAALGIDHPHHRIGIEDLDSDRLGTFDLIFSNNVLEHVTDVERALVALDAMLSAGATMVHSCPNYSVPYEPHFGLPLVPFRPASTARLLPRRIADSGLWRSLNFVTAGQVADVAWRHGREVTFDRGVMAGTVRRLTTDEEFASRHAILARLASPLRLLGGALARLPPGLATPMIFRWVRTA